MRELRAPRAAGVAGLLFSVLFVVSMLLLRHHPPPAATTAELREFYLHGDGHYINLVGFYLAPFAGIAFLWFIAVMRHQIGHERDRFFDTVFYGSGLVFVAMVFAAAASAGAVAAAIRLQRAPVPSSGIVDFGRALAYSLLYVFGVRMAAVFMIVSSTVGLRGGGLPRWFVYTGWIFALLLLVSVSFYELIVLVFPLWVGAVSLVILSRWHGPTDALTGTPS